MPEPFLLTDYGFVLGRCFVVLFWWLVLFCVWLYTTHFGFSGFVTCVELRVFGLMLVLRFLLFGFWLFQVCCFSIFRIGGVGLKLCLRFASWVLG